MAGVMAIIGFSVVEPMKRMTPRSMAGKMESDLRLGPAVALVQKQVGRLAVDAQALFGHLEYVAHVGHAAGDGVELHEGGARGLRDDGGQRGLARARRAPEDGAGQAVGLDGAAQELALAHDLLLPDEL